MLKIANFPLKRDVLLKAIAKRFEGTHYGKMAEDAIAAKQK